MTIRMRVLPRFPARIYGRDGFIVLRDGADLVVGPDYGSLITTPALVDLTTKFFQVYNADDNSYVAVSAQNLADEIQGLLVEGTLAAIGETSPAADQSIYFLEGGIAAVYTITQAGRDLVAGINAAAQRVTLGLGDLAIKSTINNADWNGADLAIENGGTGASSAAAARTALGVPSTAEAVPAGGTTGQVLGKSSGSDYAVAWIDAGAGDMLKATYDPTNINASAFVRSNHTGDMPDTVAVYDPVAPTKKARLDAGAVTAGQTRVLSMPDKDIDLADYFRAGVVVGSAYTEYTSYFGSADVIPVDDTIPQSTEGSGILSLSYTPKSVSNKLRIRAVIQASADALRNIVAALFVGGGSSAVKTAYVVSAGAGYHVNVVLEYEMLAGSTVAMNISVRAGPGGAGTCYFNGLSSGRLFGGTSGCTLTVEEIKP